MGTHNGSLIRVLQTYPVQVIESVICSTTCHHWANAAILGPIDSVHAVLTSHTQRLKHTYALWRGKRARQKCVKPGSCGTLPGRVVERTSPVA